MAGGHDDDPHDLARFVAAQDPAWDDVRAELTDGRKRSHWMWFVFPQLLGLGRSLTARRYAIASLDEARALLAHPTLGPRLREATGLMLNHEGRSLHAILGPPDDLKFVSSMTLFEVAAKHSMTKGASAFGDALDRMNDGERDRTTLESLAS